MPFDGRNRIMIYGPKNDGTYIVDPGRYSIRPNCRLPVGATPNDVLGSRLLDYRIVLFDHYVCGWIRRTLNTALSATVLGGYPETHGWLHIVDVVFGLALVAYSEEIVFRRCARHCSRFI